MSSAVVSTSAALGHPFVFDAKAVAEVSLPSEPEEAPPQICPTQGRPPQPVHRSDLSGDLAADPKLASVTAASQLDIRPAPKMVSSGIPAIDALTGGLPRGCLTEICGPASSGRTTLLLAALAAATRRGEFCVVVDASDALDPQSAVDAGVDLERLLWVRCGESSPRRNRDTEKQISQNSENRIGLQSTKHQAEHRLEHVLRAADLLLESGGFGLIVLDLGDLPPQATRYIPLTTWFRFRRAVEHTPTMLLAIEQHPIAGSCASLLLQLEPPSDPLLPVDEMAAEERKKISISEQSVQDFQIANPAHAQLLTGLDITTELIRSRLDRKPARSVAFASHTAWAG